MPKNIVVLCDGTGQEGGEGPPTNIYKLFNMILDRTPEQIAYYDRGLGTGWGNIKDATIKLAISRNPLDAYPLIVELFKSIGLIGAVNRFLRCYKFVHDNFQVGDRIFLFGFGNGASIAIRLAGFIHVFGILPIAQSELIGRAYRIYNIESRKKREEKAAEFVAKHHTMWTRITFLGVWDTVSALEIPYKPVDVVVDRLPVLRYTYHSLRLAESVENAYHALAIDDERLTFHPTLWDPQITEHQTMKQVWFCGMHTDVGGGYPEQQLSDIALEWMVKKATAHGLMLYPSREGLIHGDPDGAMHDSRGGTFSRYYRQAVRSWNPNTHGKPTVHESVLKRTLNPHNGKNPPYKPWILDGSLDYDVEPWERL